MAIQLNSETILAKVLRSTKGQRIAHDKLQKRVDAAKADLLREFDESPITRELLQGPEQPYSEILPEGYGNLFSFLGFPAGSVPTESVRKLLESIRLKKKPKVENTKFTFTMRVPSDENIQDASPMVWESGRSWVEAVTHGLGTFSHYMFSLTQGRFKNAKRNSSGTAVQVKTNLHVGSSYLIGRRYVIGMLGDFKRKFIR